MKTNIENIATIIASAIWADNAYDEAEKETVMEIAEALEIETEPFVAAVDAQVAKLADMDDEKASNALFDAAEKVDSEEIGEVFESAMQILISDNELTYTEVANLLTIADALGIEDEMAVLMLADLVKTEPELEINFDEE